MRFLEHRRHGPRDGGRDALSPAGWALARRIGPSLGPFDRVVASPKIRAVETATALAGRVDAERHELAGLPGEVEARVAEADVRSFDGYVDLARSSTAVGEFARSQADLWKEELARLPEDGHLLLVSHAGVIELGAAGAIPRVALGWGRPLAPLEGVRLGLERGRWVTAAVLRVSPPE